MNRFQLESMRSGVAQELKKASDKLAGMYADAGSSMEDRQRQKTVVEDAKERLEGINTQIKALDDEAEARLRKQSTGGNTDDPKVAKATAKGDFYKAVMTGGNPSEVIKKAYSHLGAIPKADTDLGYGDRLLPTNMSNELIIEPYTENPMRAVVRVSNITGLEEPKLIFDLDGESYDNITDKDTAKEIKTEGDKVSYGRNKIKVKAKISDTVLHGSSLNLAAEVDNALRSGLAANEMRRMFAAAPTGDYAGMSFYSTQNGVKRVTGTDKRRAIAKALADLPLQFRRNAKIVMNAIDWYDMWGGNLNQSGMYYEDRPLMLYGKQVVLVDDAISPVVGDFNYARINYDIGTLYDTDKDVDAGIYKFVLTAWYDIKLRLKSAFRIAEETTNP